MTPKLPWYARVWCALRGHPYGARYGGPRGLWVCEHCDGLIEL